MRQESVALQEASETSKGSRDSDGLHKRRGVWHYKLKIAGHWREVSTRTTNYREARRIRQQALQAQEEGRLPTDMAKWPFEKAAAQWLEARRGRVAPKTYSTERERLKPLLKFFGRQRLAEITGNEVSTYQQKRSAMVSPKTINLECGVLRMILKTARLWFRAADDYQPLPQHKKGPGRALAADEEKRLFETAASNPEWNSAYYAALIAANTTACGCEIKGLRLVDVDLLSRTIAIRRSSTKTDAGCRMIPLNETAAWALARLLERAGLLGATEPDHYLFPAFRFRYTKEGKSAGAGYDPTKPVRSWRSAWRSLTRAVYCPNCGLIQQPGAVCKNEACKRDIKNLQSPSRGLRFHDLRHHCITRLAEAGVPEQTLMAIAGHVSRKMLEHYSHIRMQAKREAVAALEPPKPAEPTEQQAVLTVQ